MEPGIILGHDTEFFLVDRKGKAIPAHTVFPEKKDAAKVDCDGLDGSYYRDGYALEVNSPAGACRGYVWNDFMQTLEAAREDIPSSHIHISTIPYVDVDLKDLREAPPDVLKFGCAPTFNAYTGRRTSIRANAASVPFRTAASHIHCSVEEKYQKEAFDRLNSGPSAAAPYVKLADFMIGVPATWLQMGGPLQDLEFKRRALYGRAGEFRIHHHPSLFPLAKDGDKSPTLEYRVCSALIARDPAIFGLFLGLMREVVIPFAPSLSSLFTPSFEEDVQKAINTGEGLDTLMKKWLLVLEEYSDSLYDDDDALFETSKENLDSKGMHLFRKWTQSIPPTTIHQDDGHEGFMARLENLGWRYS